MIDVSEKLITLRTAAATGEVLCEEETLSRIQNNTLPKGNLFDVARAAGLLASKNTHNLIPHCHPVSIDSLNIDFQLQTDGEKGVVIKAEGKSIGRTGIEMEILTAVSVTALTIYDLLKPIDKNLEISDVKLLEKTGGRTDKRYRYRSDNRAAILVCSDSTAAGKREDKSGKIIQEILLKHNVEVVDYKIVADEADVIQKQIKQWVEEDVQFVFTSGGTGLGPRDHTVDAVKAIIDKEADGISEAMRAYGGMRTPFAMLSRSVCGTIGKSIIVTLPGSSNGAREGLNAIIPAVFHGRKMLLGGGH